MEGGEQPLPGIHWGIKCFITLCKMRKNSGTLVMVLQELERLGCGRDLENMQPITWIYGTLFFGSQSGINGVEWQWKTKTVIKGNIGVLPCCHGTISQAFSYPLTCTEKQNHLGLAPNETSLTAECHQKNVKWTSDGLPWQPERHGFWELWKDFLRTWNIHLEGRLFKKNFMIPTEKTDHRNLKLDKKK